MHSKMFKKMIVNKKLLNPNRAFSTNKIVKKLTLTYYFQFYVKMFDFRKNELVFSISYYCSPTLTVDTKRTTIIFFIKTFSLELKLKLFKTHILNTHNM